MLKFFFFTFKSNTKKNFYLIYNPIINHSPFYVWIVSFPSAWPSVNTFHNNVDFTFQVHSNSFVNFPMSINFHCISNGIRFHEKRMEWKKEKIILNNFNINLLFHRCSRCQVHQKILIENFEATFHHYFASNNIFAMFSLFWWKFR